MSEWQSIETAPKDGGEFIAYRTPIGGAGEYLLARWGTLNDGGAFAYSDGTDATVFVFDLTHWMPLPEPPK